MKNKIFDKLDLISKVLAILVIVLWVCSYVMNVNLDLYISLYGVIILILYVFDKVSK